MPVDAVGFDQITEAAASPQRSSSPTGAATGLTFDEDSLDDVASEVSGCGDVLDELVASTEMSDEDRTCVEDNLDNDQLAELLVSGFFGVDRVTRSPRARIGRAGLHQPRRPRPLARPTGGSRRRRLASLVT